MLPFRSSMAFLNRTAITISILPKIQARVSRSCSTPDPASNLLVLNISYRGWRKMSLACLFLSGSSPGPVLCFRRTIQTLQLALLRASAGLKSFCTWAPLWTLQCTHISFSGKKKKKKRVRHCHPSYVFKVVFLCHEYSVILYLDIATFVLLALKDMVLPPLLLKIARYATPTISRNTLFLSVVSPFTFF